VRCVAGSKLRMVSISSPKKSRRTGFGSVGRPHIEDAAAMRELTGLKDGVHTLIADPRPLTHQTIGLAALVY
jgi:hypothetical protein